MLGHWILLEIPFRLSDLLGESNWLHLLRAAWMLELGWPSAGIQVRGWTPAVQPRPRLSASSPLIHFLSARFVHRKMPWQLQTWAMSKADRRGPKHWTGGKLEQSWAGMTGTKQARAALDRGEAWTELGRGSWNRTGLGRCSLSVSKMQNLYPVSAWRLLYILFANRSAKVYVL